MKWTRVSTWRKLRDKPVVFLAGTTGSREVMARANAQALIDLFDLMANVRMQPGVHRFIFDESCRLDRVERWEADREELP